MNTRLLRPRCLPIVPIAIASVMHLFSPAAAAQANQRGASSSNTMQQSCEHLQILTLPQITITSATLEPSGPLPSPPGQTAVQAPARCVVKAISRPTSDSNINIEVWLPTQNWNKRYQQVGNAGWAGSIQTEALADALQRGYAAASTDDGHQGGTDAAFVVGHPEKLIDFGYRALRETAVTAKAVIAAFYGTPAAHSYFNGCSDGGREALMEAQRFPEDFDGIIAGAPANNWSHLLTGHAWDMQALTATPASAIPPAKLPAIHQAVLAACDAKDGLRDGLLSDPRTCHFDPAVLTCKASETSECLTKPQVEALAKIYAGPRNPVTGAQIFPGYEPGTETSPGSWSGWIIADAPEHTIQYFFATSYFQDAVFERTPWSLKTMDFDKDVALADQKVGTIVSSINPDLRTFRDHGGKLIQYHGWGDGAIAPMNSINYYEQVGSFLAKYPDPRPAPSNARPQSQSDFYRLFMVPGLGHCFGGAGPVNFGQLVAQSADGRGDPERDILAALVQWVESGIAPEKLIGTGASPADPSKTISRLIYPYPATTQYKGQGDPNNAASFSDSKP